MSDKNLFEIASRKAYRFPSARGELTVEQLWSLNLKNQAMFDLNSVAVALAKSLKEVSEESFVSVNPAPGKADLENKLEIVKHIISVKQDEQAKARDRAEKAAKREKFVQALANKEDQELAALTPDEIRAKLAELDE